MKKRLIALCCTLAMACAFGTAAMADSYSAMTPEQVAASAGYEITDYQIDATVHTNNTVSQTETITVNFLEERHGIFRAFPETVTVQQTDDSGQLRDMAYMVHISNVSVSGGAYEAYSEDGYYYIKIGSEHQTLSGSHTYTISFLYDIGDDRIEASDMFFYSLNGPDWDTVTQHLAATVRFEKTLPADVAYVQAFAGAYGSTAAVDIPVQNNAIALETQSALYPGDSITLYTQLPAGYFEGQRMYGGVGVCAAAAVLVLLALLVAGVFRAKYRKRRVVPTVEFYPPDGITSAEVGYITDHSADDKDIMSLLLWLADKGYLSIEEQKKDTLLLTKKREPEPALPQYVHSFWGALFPAGKSECSTADFGSSFATGFLSAKQDLMREFIGKRKLAVGRAASVLCSALSAVAFAGALLLCTGGVSDGAIVGAIAGGVLLLAAGLLLGVTVVQRYFLSAGARIGILAACAVLYALAVACALAVAFYGVVPFVLPLALGAAGIVANVLAGTTGGETEYCADVTGKLLGFRDFIKTAELDQLKMLAAENPQYFYSVLPYAYVFGLTDIWFKRFADIAVPQPDWYYGGDGWNTMMIYHMMHHGMHGAVSAAVKTVTHNAGGGGGTSFGGGGGFSGGGFGGGGGGSW